MTDAKFSDIDKQVYPKDACYQITVRNFADNTELKFDIAKTQWGETIENASKLAIQNGCSWAVPAWLQKKEKK